MRTLAQYCLENGGIVSPLIIPSDFTNGTSLFNPSVFVDDDGTVLTIIRHCQYTLYHSEKRNFEHQWGPLLYLNPENDISLTTKNYLAELNDNLKIKRVYEIDTKDLDKKPKWSFVGLEDARLVKWEGRYYICGVRRDTTTNGQGRMELSEIDYPSRPLKEVSRQRIPAPGKDDTYCEKNWMPILDKPFHYIKWSNPVQVVKYNPEDKTTVDVCIKDFKEDVTQNARGGSQVVPYKDGYIAIQHITYLYKTPAGRKDADYKHQITVYDKDWNVIRQSKIFSFMGARIEFTCGMARKGGNFLISFGVTDNAAYIMRLSETTLEEFINE